MERVQGPHQTDIDKDPLLKVGLPSTKPYAQLLRMYFEEYEHSSTKEDLARWKEKIEHLRALNADAPGLSPAEKTSARLEFIKHEFMT